MVTGAPGSTRRVASRRCKRVKSSPDPTSQPARRPPCRPATRPPEPRPDSYQFGAQSLASGSARERRVVGWEWVFGGEDLLGGKSDYVCRPLRSDCEGGLVVWWSAGLEAGGGGGEPRSDCRADGLEPEQPGALGHSGATASVVADLHLQQIGAVALGGVDRLFTPIRLPNSPLRDDVSPGRTRSHQNANIRSTQLGRQQRGGLWLLGLLGRCLRGLLCRRAEQLRITMGCPCVAQVGHGQARS